MKKLTLLTLAALSPSVFAVENGTNVSVSDYELINYTVQMTRDLGSDTTGYCSAQLIAGEWLLTARHCTPYFTEGSSGESLTDPRYDNEPMDLKLYQGVEGAEDSSNLIYDGKGYVYTIGGKVESELMYDTYVTDYLNSIVNYDCNTDSAGCTSSRTVSYGSNRGADIALIKLDKVLSYQQTLQFARSLNFAAVTGLSALENYAADSRELLQLNETVNFRGWGKDENNQSVSQMQQATMDLASDVLSYECYVGASLCDSTNLVNPSSVSLFLDLSEVVKFNANPGRVNSGDSGTALTTSDNKLIGVASAASNGGEFISTEMYLPWIAETINAINAPSEVDLNAGTDSYNVTIQNLSLNTNALNVFVVDTKVPHTTTCGVTLNSLETCTVSLDLSSLTGNQIVEVNVSADKKIKVNLAEQPDTNPVEPTPTDPVSGGGSSGGSVGWGLFGLFLMAFALRRK
ncbi:trypsin-like serine protease [Vibrio crassostreae]|uniref:trypsin-like serine protease n=1 Tax=Vibrio crassostreae TaxID=246167 RepID=UPI001B30700D|nr:trypsin-like serine protease [Vibrio crassostreae]